MRICIDPGHGGAEPGCSGFGKVEKNLNLEYAIKLKTELEKYEYVNVIMTRINDSAISLNNRTKLANDVKCDLFISCHLNAYDSLAYGTEIIYSMYAKESFKEFCKTLGMNLANALGITFRRSYSMQGQEGDYYYVIRETVMPAIIIEALFLDNENDNKHYDSNKIAKSICTDIANYYKLTKKEEEIQNVYRVVCGSFKNKENAQKRVEELKNKGFDSFIVYK